MDKSVILIIVVLFLVLLIIGGILLFKSSSNSVRVNSSASLKNDSNLPTNLQNSSSAGTSTDSKINNKSYGNQV